MSEKTYTLEEVMAITGQFIEEQALVLKKNLREKKKFSTQFNVCVK